MFSMRTLLLITLGVFVSNSGEAADLPSAAALEKLGLELHWNSQAVLNVRRDKISHITNDEENVYLQSSAGVLTVFHAENGQRRWVAQVGRTDEAAMHAVSNDDTVLVVAGPVAYGFNKFDGTPLFEFRLPSPPTAAPALDDTSFYVPMSGGALYAYSLRILEHEFRYGTLPDTVALPHLWRFICAEEIIHPPVIGDLAVAFVTESGSLHSVNVSGLERGRSRFQLVLNKPASAPPAIIPNENSHSVIVATEDNQIFSVDLVKGANEWIYPMGRPMKQTPVVVGDDVLVITEDGTLTKLSRNPLTPYWGRPVEVPQYVSPVYIGAAIVPMEIDPDTQDAMRLLADQAVQVLRVFPGGAASAAGLLAGDRIVAIDDTIVSSAEDAQSILAELPWRIERPLEVLRVSMGASLQGSSLPTPVRLSDDTSANYGVKLTDITRNSPAAAAGFQVGDIIVALEDVPIESVDDLRRKLTMAAPGQVTVKALRNRKGVMLTLKLAAVLDNTGRPTDASAISVHRLRIRIPVINWDVPGISSLTAVGRFGIYGIDVTNRLVAFDRETAQMKGRVPVTGYRVHHNNTSTDFIYLASDSGDVACLREIGTTVNVPELSPSTRTATVRQVNVNYGDGVEATGSLLCQLELPDGETMDISVSVKGVVSRVYVRQDDIVQVGQPLFQIAEDKFATYHQKPDKRPIDIEPAAGGAASQPDDSVFP